MLNARLKDLSIGRTVESETEPLATRAPMMECRSCFYIEQVVSDGTVQYNLRTEIPLMLTHG